MAKTLALDQAARTSGWAFFKDGALKECGTFTIKPTLSMARRLGAFWEHLNDLYYTLEFDQLVYEGIQYQNNAETHKKLAYIQAAILLWSDFEDIPAEEMIPSHWRKVLSEKFHIKFGGKRAEQKRAAQAFVGDKYGLDVSEDCADAVCIGTAYMAQKTKRKSAF